MSDSETIPAHKTQEAPGGEAAPRAVFRPGGSLHAFSFPNFRRFFFGQLVSVAGTWMQTVAQQWLVYDLTRSSVWLGIVAGASAIPYVLFAFKGGEVADRFPRRTILLWTQSLSMIFAFALAILATNRPVPIQGWHIAVFAGLSGIVNAFNMPAQQAFVTEMVDDPRAISNAIALNSLRFNLARFLGPMLAGIALVRLSAAACFFLNGLSFIAVLISLSRMRLPTATRERGGATMFSPWEGVRFLGSLPSLWRVTVLIGVTSLFVLSVSTLFPVLAERYGQGAVGFGTMVTVNGIGATVGGTLVVAVGNRIPRRLLVYGGALQFCAFLAVLAWSRSYPLALICLFFAGIGMVVFTTSANTKVQEDAPNYLRGRVMAVYSLVANALMPAGGLLLGFLSERYGPFLTIRIVSGLAFSVTLFLLLVSQREVRESNPQN
ncbi:MAG: MFS transporter [Capsulimonadales bacterium]|nr:MFS transporter [Capsulimonadales bacterium]